MTWGRSPHPERHTDHVVHLYAKRVGPVQDAELVGALNQGALTVAAGGIYQGDTTTCVSGSTLPQFALPIATVAATGTWESQPGQADANLHLNINEMPAGTHDGNASYILGNPPFDQDATFRLAPLQPPSSLFDVKLHVVHLRPEPEVGDVLEAKLWQGHPAGTLIATFTFSPSSVWQDEFYRLTEAEAQSVTDWSDLYVSLVLESSPASGELRITQVYLEAAHGALSFIDCSTPPGTPAEQCGIKLIPYREPVYPYRRRMAGLLKNGRIAVCVATRSAQHSPRRTWVGALRSDGRIGEGTKGLGRAIVGHAVRDLEARTRRFAIARASCDPGCITCSQESRVSPTICYEADMPGGRITDEFRFMFCRDALAIPFYITEAADGLQFQSVLGKLEPTIALFPLCNSSSVPPLGPSNVMVPCKMFGWRSLRTKRSFELLEVRHQAGDGFAGYLGGIVIPFFTSLPPTCTMWLTDPDWPFAPTRQPVTPSRFPPGFVPGAPFPEFVGPCVG